MSFSTDRRWMYEMTINGYHNLKYGENVDKFLDFAYSNHGSVERKLNSSGEIVYQIKCPCTRCKNIHYREREVVENHLLSRGFKPNYYTWDEHGETFINEVGVGHSSLMEDDQTDDDVDDDNDDDDDLCRRMVLDSMHPTGHGEEHVPNKNAKSFYESICSFESWIKESEPLIEDGQLDIKKENMFANWLEREVTLTPNDRNALLKDLTRGPLSEVRSHKGYLINGYKFHTQTAYDGRVTQNSGVCVKGASYNQTESDYYGILDDILEIEYHSRLGRCVVVVFKCTWFDPVQGVRVDRKHKLVDIKHTKKGCFDDPFILASHAQQVYYLPYPSMKDWWAVVKTSPRVIYEVAEDSSDISVVEDDDNVAGDHFLQENERLDLTSTNEDIEPFPFQQGYVEEVVDDANDDDDQDEDEDEDESD